MSINNQLVEQTILVSQNDLTQSRVSKRISLFNEDGTPIKVGSAIVAVKDYASSVGDATAGIEQARLVLAAAGGGDGNLSAGQVAVQPLYPPVEVPTVIYQNNRLLDIIGVP